MDTPALRDTLIDAALELLEREGDVPSLRAVARTAGVSAMAPYRHFPDKAGLLAAVATHGFELLYRTLSEADRQADAREALVAQGLAYIDFARAHPALFGLMYSQQYGSATPEAVVKSYDVLAHRVAAIVPKHAAAATLACRALVQGMAMIEMKRRLLSAKPEDVGVALRLFVAGLDDRAPAV